MDLETFKLECHLTCLESSGNMSLKGLSALQSKSLVKMINSVTTTLGNPCRSFIQSSIIYPQRVVRANTTASV